MRAFWKVAAVMVAVLMVGILLGPGKAEALTVRVTKPNTATPCASGSMWDVTTSACKPITYSGSSTTNAYDQEVRWSYNNSTEQWDLVMIIQAPDLTGTTTYSLQLLLYSTTDSPSKDSNWSQLFLGLPDDFTLPTLEFSGFDLRSAPKFYSIQTGGNTPLWNRGQIIDTTPVPEPSTILLLGAGFAAMAGLAIRRRKAKP
jgi:hypothetical protein